MGGTKEADGMMFAMVNGKVATPTNSNSDGTVQIQEEFLLEKKSNISLSLKKKQNLKKSKTLKMLQRLISFYNSTCGSFVELHYVIFHYNKAHLLSLVVKSRLNY